MAREWVEDAARLERFYNASAEFWALFNVAQNISPIIHYKKAVWGLPWYVALSKTLHCVFSKIQYSLGLLNVSAIHVPNMLRADSQN